MATINGRLSVIETKLKYIEKLLYGLIVVIAAELGITFI